MKNVPSVPSIYCVYKRRGAVNGLAAGGLFSAVPVSWVAKSPDMSLLHFFPVTDERSGRTPIWACQRMGLPSSLSGEKKEMQTGSVSCWWKQKNLCNSFSSHLMCFLCILHTNQPGDSSRRTKGSQCCCLCLPRALCRAGTWSLMVPAWHSLLAPCLGGKPSLIFDLSPLLFWLSVPLCRTRKHV